MDTLARISPRDCPWRSSTCLTFTSELYHSSHYVSKVLHSWLYQERQRMYQLFPLRLRSLKHLNFQFEIIKCLTYSRVLFSISRLPYLQRYFWVQQWSASSSTGGFSKVGRSGHITSISSRQLIRIQDAQNRRELSAYDCGINIAVISGCKVFDFG